MNADKNPIPGNKKFGIDQPLPSSEAKKAGWERRKQAQKMMDKIKEYMSMSQKDFSDFMNDIKENPDKHTVEDVLLYKYVTKAFNGEKFMLDWFDRNISKAPQDLGISGPNGGPIKLKIGLMEDGIQTNEQTESTDPSSENTQV